VAAGIDVPSQQPDGEKEDGKESCRSLEMRCINIRSAFTCFLPMKTFPAVCLLGLLALAPLRAQEPSASPADPSAAGAPAPQEALLQQLLQLATQALVVTQHAPAAGGTTETAPATRATEQETLRSPLVQQVLRLAAQAISELQRQAASPADATAARNGDLLTEFLNESAAPVTAPGAGSSNDDSAVSKMAHAWDSALSTGGLHTGSLQTGSLQTGRLQTGTLQTGSLDDAPVRVSGGGLGRSVADANDLAPTAVRPVSAAPTVSAPPANPDDEMRRWSRQIDGEYSSEQAARDAAVRDYPALAVPGSTFNKQFRARYAQYRQADPFGFLRGPGWPMKLAIFTDGDLKRQQSGTALSP
jgi:hypothetical protein